MTTTTTTAREPAMLVHPDMIETTPPRPSRRKRKAAPNPPPPTPGKNAPRPILGKRAVRGIHRLIAALPASACVDDPDMTAAVRWLVNYVAWHESPAIVAKRKTRGASIKNWSAKQAARIANPRQTGHSV